MIIEINQACDLVIFGTKGDLAKRKLLPALYKLEKSKKIHDNTRIIGAGRADWNRLEYKKIVKTAIQTFLNEKFDNFIWEKFSTRLYFCNIDVYETLHFFRLKEILQKQKNINIFYCAVPPNTLNSIFKGLGDTSLNSEPARIVLEKPLGICLKTSKLINDQISKYFLESQIFRIDHYLGKESVLNLLALRFANSFFFQNWDNQTIDHIQITVSEEVGIEDRWNYFDKMGQMRDMVQNHLLQILTIIAMDQPKNLTSEDIREKKLNILGALKRIDINNINMKTVRGQYCAGIIKGKKVFSYIEESGSNKSSQTETFVAIKVEINNKKWFGVPFYLRTGKRLSHKYSEIVVVFKKNPINLFKNSHLKLSHNKLIIRLEPNPNIKIDIFNKIPGLKQEYELESSQLEYNHIYQKNYKNSIDAYERLLLESMRGIQSLFVSREEVEEAWKWIDPIINAWKEKNKNILQLYISGTWGPKNSDLLLTREGRFWHKFQ
ncbi:glucose-6-phosphate dehydrogenase [Buchnera aphidicola]|uniref:Glucose-6-phosphate 1-dehydrogenase n=1 Tax=Buchnera aphidicola str. USDA (Myzus persicae) TaxID=1009856 RepID=W0P4R4_BUCMP|nr:glucose-6-phosphate dehydrogenase [Buchnera aphidicola]AHG60063.1 Zwf [Buchnera aphidicola str. USDA (Myzus persicae)]AHG60643.1 Zwf [Buchnera aphidicola str. W106 (Myzus persicae)]AHG61215.1 Zwf [Buchnera aphidicola str. G002 (Myzus persicae)]AHG61788.1 Zwf [Buchnera aphidicola str. F009 (Myzus persicae)]WAI03252.1 MAG: glucose-6-phosphate dehydrogenase [Buchnera aphidicola (Myzus persicae)]